MTDVILDALRRSLQTDSDIAADLIMNGIDPEPFLTESLYHDRRDRYHALAGR